MLVVIMGMMIFSGLAYVSEKDEEGTMFISMPQVQYTDEKENQIFLIYKEIQNGAVAKSYTATAIPFIYSFSGNSAASAPISTFMCL